MLRRHRLLNTEQVFEELRLALEHKKPWSLVRIGDGENRFLAQDSVWSMEQTMKDRWARKANSGKKVKGVTFPNLPLRDLMVESIRQAHVVGLLQPGDKTILAPVQLKRPLTDRLFAYFKLNPPATCDALVFRSLAKKADFWTLLRRQRILLITRNAKRFERILKSEPYQLQITRTIPFSHCEQMPEALEKIAAYQDHFDIALISCGVNAVVLAPKVAEHAGKVGIDMGKALTEFLPGRRLRKIVKK